MKNFLSRALSGLLLIALTAWASPQQSRAEIHATVIAFVRAQTLALPGDVSIKVDEVDRRIAVPACPVMEAFLPSGGQLLGNATVGVRCQDRNGWTLFVPVHVKVNTSLLIASRPLQQGQVLRAEDLATQSGELAQSDILTDLAQAIGKVLKFGVGAGQVLRQTMLRTPYAVSQGQTVQLQIEGQGYQVHSEGQALNNAAEGQHVRVKTSSGQIVNGVARPDGTVGIRPRQEASGKQ